jgi:hypothetical protein
MLSAGGPEVMNRPGLPGDRPFAVSGTIDRVGARQGNSSMSNRTSQGEAQTLVEALKEQSRDLHDIGKEAREKRRKLDSEAEPKVRDRKEVLDLWDRCARHPLYDLIRLVEAHTGIPRGTVLRLAHRLNTSNGAGPVIRARSYLPCPDPDEEGLPDEEQRPDLPDLLPVVAQFRTCDADGTTAAILRQFRAQHPQTPLGNPADVLAANRSLGEPIEYITLDQMAAHVNRSKKTLERLKTRTNNPLPPPAVQGGGGKADEWVWSQVRPWLEKEFDRRLPERFPRITG